MRQEARRKAEELEKISAAGRKLLDRSLSAAASAAAADDGAGDEPAAKRIRTGPATADAAGAGPVDAFLAAFAKIPLDSLPPAEALRRAQELVASHRDAVAPMLGLPAASAAAAATAPAAAVVTAQ